MPAAAQPGPPEGHWNVEWLDGTAGTLRDSARLQVSLESGRFSVTGCHSIYRSPARPDGVRRGICGWKYWTTDRVSVDGGTVTVREPTHVLGTYGGVTTLRFVDADTGRGTWKYERQRRRAEGTVVWRRSRAAVERAAFRSRIDSETRPGAAPAEVREIFDDAWRSGRGYREGRPTIAVELYGTEFWGNRSLSIVRNDAVEPMLEIYDRHPIPGVGADNDGVPDIGIRFKIAIWRDAVPGPYAILFDGTRIPFELRVDGHPTRPRLSVVVAKTASDAVTARPVTTLPPDGVFWFRAEYGVDPGADAPKSRTLSIRWEGGHREIRLLRREDAPRVYLSEPYYGIFGGAPRPTARPGETTRALRSR